MDRQLNKSYWDRKSKYQIGILFLIIVIICIYFFYFKESGSSLYVSRDKLIVTQIETNVFQEYIIVTGKAIPERTFFLDAIEGGIIKQIYRESGTKVNKDDVIIELTNSKLELDVLNREAQLYEQQTLMRNTRLALDQNNLNQQALLAEIEYQLQLLIPQYKRFSQLSDKKMITDREYEEIKERYEYFIKRKKLTYASYLNDSLARVNQLRQLVLSEARINNSLIAVRSILNNLKIRSSSVGVLATPELQIGQSITNGERLGQIDVIGKYKMRVSIDQLYLPKINEGLKGEFEFSGKRYSATIEKIYPLIKNGVFEVDLEMQGEISKTIKMGQTFNIKLELGSKEKALLIPTGSFYKTTGGNWIFVLDSKENKAYKKEVRLGRKNPDFYQVLEGLKEGDYVITSSYEEFGENETLILK